MIIDQNYYFQEIILVLVHYQNKMRFQNKIQMIWIYLILF